MRVVWGERVFTNLEHQYMLYIHTYYIYLYMYIYIYYITLHYIHIYICAYAICYIHVWSFEIAMIQPNSLKLSNYTYPVFLGYISASWSIVLLRISIMMGSFRNRYLHTTQLMPHRLENKLPQNSLEILYSRGHCMTPTQTSCTFIRKSLKSTIKFALFV